MLHLYNLLLYLLTPFLAVSLLLRSFRVPEYRSRIKERFGVLPSKLQQDYIWLHSVSVGETLAARPLVLALIERYPEKRLLITTMTPTGSEQVRRSFGESVDHVYAPYDLPGSVARFLNRTKPCIAIIMETELWPNTLRQCARNGVPSVLINARLSEQSAAGYARVSGVAQTMMDNLSAVAVQGDADGQRFKALGLSANKLTVSGSIKFDYTIDADTKATTALLRQQWQGVSKRLVWIAASTHHGEDELILKAHQQLLAQDIAAVLILVPRHPERFEDVYQLCTGMGLKVVRRSTQQDIQYDTQIVLGDTMGELAALYGACDIAFVGGSLIERGGHNPIEPAAWGLPILTGPHMFNFVDIAAQLIARGGLHYVYSAADIAKHLSSVLTDPAQHQKSGAANKAVVEENRGATQRQLQVVCSLID